MALADVVLVGTGYFSSWHDTFFDGKLEKRFKILADPFTDATAEALGIQRHPPPASDTDE